MAGARPRDAFEVEYRETSFWSCSAPRKGFDDSRPMRRAERGKRDAKLALRRFDVGRAAIENTQKRTGFGPHLASSRALRLHPFEGYVRSSEITANSDLAVAALL